MRKILSIDVLVFIILLIYSQNCNSSNEKLDTLGNFNRSRAFETIQRYTTDLSLVGIDSNRAKINNLLTNAINLDEKRISAEIYRLLGDFYAKESLNDSAIFYYQKALTIGSDIDYDYYYPYIDYKIADRYWEMGNYSQALEDALLLRSYYEKRNTLEDQEYLFNLFGIIYLRLQDYSSALENLQHSIKISERKKNLKLLGVSYANIGSLFFQQEKYIEALENYEKGVNLEVGSEQFMNAGRSYESIAKVYLAIQDSEKAKQLLEKAIEYNQKANDLIGYARTYSTYGRLYNYLKDYNKSIEYLKRAEEYSIKCDLREYNMNVCEQLSIAYYGQKDYQKAFSYQVKYFNLYKQVYNIQDYTNTKKIENELRTEKKNNELNRLVIEKQRSYTVFYFVVIILSATISALFILMYLRSLKSRRSLLALNTEINQQKENLQEINIELDVAKRNAENANQLKSHFLRNISHEIRTPLNGIVGLSEIIVTKSLSDEEKQNYLYIIKNSSNQLISTIDNLVEMAHITTNQVKAQKSHFNPEHFLADIYKTYKFKIADFNKNISFSYSSDTANEVSIYSDFDLLKKILLQLLDNAIKFTKKGEITIGYNLYDNSIRFFVRDTGIGISESSKEFVYELFRQEQETLSREYEGIGLGLTIAKELSTLLNGKLWFESIKDKGTTFFIDIPISA